MAARVDVYRAELRALQDWGAYLKQHSGLPGPRANLELVQAVGDVADSDRLWRLSASSDEFLALCGTAGLGRVAANEPDAVMSWLRELAADSRWRVREGVAMALQRIGRESMPHLLAEMRTWAEDRPFVQRAAAAGLCEPGLLKKRDDAVHVLDILDRITSSLAAAGERKNDGFRALRQALGYCWSVAAAAAPEDGRAYFEKWLRSTDRDVAWIMRSNLSKARVAGLSATLASPASAKSRAKLAARRKPKAGPATRSRGRLRS